MMTNETTRLFASLNNWGQSKIKSKRNFITFIFTLTPIFDLLQRGKIILVSKPAGCGSHAQHNKSKRY